jgi:integrase
VGRWRDCCWLIESWPNRQSTLIRRWGSKEAAGQLATRRAFFLTVRSVFNQTGMSTMNEGFDDEPSIEQEAKPRRGRPAGSPQPKLPKIKLTERIVKSLPVPAVGQVEYRDIEVAGLSLRVSHRGTKAYYLKYYLAGKQRRLHLGTTAQFRYEDAKAEAHLAWRKVNRHIDPVVEKAALVDASKAARLEISFAALAERYLRERARVERKASTYREYARLIGKFLLPVWGSRPAKSIDRAAVREVLGALGAEGKHTQANRLHATISAVFKFGVDQDVLSDNPAKGVSRTKEKTGTRVLSNEEIRKLWLATEDPKIRLLMLTGQRPGEVSGMLWGEIDLDAKSWSMPGERTKNGEPHSIPLVGEAVRIVNAQVRKQDGRVFHTSLRRAFVRARAASGIKEAFTLRDLRRTFESKVAELGVLETVYRKLLNHSERNNVTARVYVKYGFNKEKRKALARWDRELQRIVSGERGKVIELAGARETA